MLKQFGFISYLMFCQGWSESKNVHKLFAKFICRWQKIWAKLKTGLVKTTLRKYVAQLSPSDVNLKLGSGIGMKMPSQDAITAKGKAFLSSEGWEIRVAFTWYWSALNKADKEVYESIHHKSYDIINQMRRFVCLIWFFTSQSTIFQLHRDGPSWVEPVLS